MEKDRSHLASESSRKESTKRNSSSGVQHRLVSYVNHEGHDTTSGEASTERDSRELRIGDAATKIVIDHEQQKGCKARDMAHANPGYDVISEGANGTRYIEVKGIQGAWGERGAAMTSKQFFYSRENPDRDHWLYVVEEVFSNAPLIHKIQNPSEKVDRFVFDGGWKQIANSERGTGANISIPTSGDEVVENNEVVGIVESTREFGKFPLVIYIDVYGIHRRKRLVDLTIRKKVS